MVNLTIVVEGRPAPQGSKRHVGNGRFVEASKFLPAWRKAVTVAAREVADDEGWATTAGPVRLEVIFYLDRPSTVSQTKRPFPIKPPDIDKLVRAVCDALTDAGVWEDDGQIVQLCAEKHYNDTRGSGCDIRVLEL